MSRLSPAGRHRASAQAIVLAAVGMAAMVGGVALVIDVGMFFVIQRQMQTAADAAALAAVWYDPVCNLNDGDNEKLDAGCQPSGPPVDLGDVCADTKHDPAHDNDATACTVALQFAYANLGPVEGLCNGPVNTPGRVHVNPYEGGTSHDPPVNVYVVAIDCEARHWFGQILPGLPLTLHIQANSAATIGWRGTTGDLGVNGDPTEVTLIARLIRSCSTGVTTC